MRLKFVLGSAVALALATSAFAQTRPPSQSQIQPRPPVTQFDRTLPVQAQAQPAQAQPQQTNPYPTPLYQRPDIAKSLNLNNDQVTKLNQLTNQTQTRYRDNYGKLGSVREADRAARTQELNQQYNSDWMKGARDVLNQDQLNRYQQLQYQYGGFTSLSDPTVQKQLNLTPDQVKSLNDQINWNNRQLQDVNRTGTTDREKGMQMYNDYQKQYQERFNKYLTPEQQKAWQTMTGQPYTFQPTWATTPPKR